MKKIIVIGGGIAGTAAAHTLVERGFDVTIIERNNYLGGRIKSQTKDGVAVEMGASFMMDFYTNMFDFMRKTGLDSDIKDMNISEKDRNIAIVRNGQAHKLSAYTFTFGRSLLSHRAKLRFLREVLWTILHWRHIDLHDPAKLSRYDTQSVAQLLQSRTGQELMEYFIQPGLAGYCYWSPERTSRAMLPVIIKAFFADKRRYVLRHGLSQIPEAAAKDSTVLLEHTVKSVTRTKDRYKIIVTDAAGKSKTLHADGVVCATTASVVPEVIKGLNKQQRDFFSSVGCSSTAAIVQYCSHKTNQPAHALAYPRKEGKHITAVTSETSRSNKKHFIEAVKVYATDQTAKKLLSSPAKLKATMLKDASSAAHADHMQLWPEALPEFDTGHFKRLQTFASGEIEQGALVFAGDYIGGPFMEGAFTSGIQAAQRLVEQFERNR